MVSTRGVKFKFQEGEKVLCYEPDPSKAKVLYDSKVLEVSVSRDTKGKKVPEYLIHFNGWNSSWDRYVTEAFILKDSEENRTLQKQLAEEAYITLKNKKKKRGLANILKATDKKRKEEKSLSEDSDSISNHNSSSDAEDEDEGDDDEDANIVSGFTLPETLKRHLEDDCSLINKKNKLVKLPCEPNVITILESYVRNFAVKSLRVSPKKPGHQVNWMKPERSINLCKEVVDGLRIYFDFTLPHLLLYNPEKKQYEHTIKNLKSNFAVRPDSSSLSTEQGCISKFNNLENLDKMQNQSSEPDAKFDKSPSKFVRKEKSDSDSPSTLNTQKRGGPLRKRMPRFGRKETPTLQVPSLKSAGQLEEFKSSQQEEPRVQAPRRGRPPKNSFPRGNCVNNNCNSNQNNTESRDDEPLQALTLSDWNSRSDNSSSPLKDSVNNRNKPLPDDLLSWNLFPTHFSENLPTPPSLVYGAQHLLRLFVKLPELLSKTTISPYKGKVLCRHLEMFISYLADRQDLFSETVYVDAYEEISNQEPTVVR